MGVWILFMFNKFNFKDRMTFSFAVNIILMFILVVFNVIVFANLDLSSNNWQKWAIGLVIIAVFFISVIYSLLKWCVDAIEKPINDATNYTNKASKSIELASSRHSTTIEKQLSLIKETDNIVKRLSLTSSDTKQCAQRVADKSNEALLMSKKGQESMHVNITNMSTLKLKIETIAEQILELSEHTQQIGSIIGVVEDITEQTNMLALNAAVEAARAGEHGRGFAVVASEIRKLSDQCKQATMKITALIYDIQQATNSTVMATEEGTKEIEAGVNLANQVANAIDALRKTMHETVEAVENIVTASKDQSRCAQDVSEVITSVSAGIKDSVDTIERTKEAVSVLKKVSDSLRSIVITENNHKGTQI